MGESHIFSITLLFIVDVLFALGSITFSNCALEQKIISGKSQATVSCSASARGINLTTYWKRRDQSIPIQAGGNKYATTTEGLIIFNISKADEMEYDFHANVKTFSWGYQRITVKVLIQPDIFNLPTFTTAKIGDQFSTLCHASGDPTPIYEWYKEGATNQWSLLKKSDRISIDKVYGQLKIELVRKNDEGQYKCSASNEAGYAEAQTRLNVQVPPIIYKVRNGTGTENAGAVISCTASGDPTPELKWKPMNSDTFYPVGQSGDSTVSLIKDETNHISTVELKLEKLKPSHMGDYICQAHNDAGDDTDYGHINVNYTAKFINQPRGPFYNWHGNENGNVTCIVNGNPLPIVQWFKGGIHIEGQSFFRQQTIADKEMFQVTSILFARLDFSNEQQILGEYMCKGINDVGTTNITVRMEQAEKPPAPDVSVYYFSTRTIRLRINIPTIRGPPVTKFYIKYKVEGANKDPDNAEAPVEWRKYKDDQPLPMIYITLENLDAKTLYIINVRAVNDVAESDPFEFTQRTRPYIEPDILNIPTFITAKAGYQFSMLCRASGNPCPIHEWYKEGALNQWSLLRNSDRILIDEVWGELKIQPVRKDDEGRYKCKASNEAGYAEAQTRLDVQVPPIITEVRNGTGTENAAAVISCTASGDPSPDLKWKPIDSDTFYSVGQSGDSTVSLTKDEVNHMSTVELKFENLKPSHMGDYTCQAHNDAGDDTEYGHLSVRYAAKFNNQPRGLFHNWHGNEKGNVTCVVNGNPLPVVQWFKGGSQIEGMSFYKIQIVEDKEKFQVTSILFATVDLSNEQQIFGNYMCKGINEVGTTSITVIMEQAEKPPAPGVSVDYFTAQTIGLVINTPTVRGAPVTKLNIKYKIQGANKDKANAENKVEWRNYQDDQPLPRTYITLENLDANTLYIITVRAVNDVGESDPFEFTQTTRPNINTTTTRPEANVSSDFWKFFGIENEISGILLFAGVGAAMIVLFTLLIIWRKCGFQCCCELLGKGPKEEEITCSKQDLKMGPVSNNTVKRATTDSRIYDEPHFDRITQSVDLEPIGITTEHIEKNNPSPSCSNVYEQHHVYETQGNNIYSTLDHKT